MRDVVVLECLDELVFIGLPDQAILAAIGKDRGRRFRRDKRDRRRVANQFLCLTRNDVFLRDKLLVETTDQARDQISLVVPGVGMKIGWSDFLEDESNGQG